MVYRKQNPFSLDGKAVRENCNLFIWFRYKGSVMNRIYNDIFTKR